MCETAYRPRASPETVGDTPPGIDRLEIYILSDLNKTRTLTPQNLRIKIKRDFILNR